MIADVLDEFTKEEIIQWVRDKGLFLRISRRDLLFIRWQMQSKKLQRDYQTELDRWDAEKPDFKKRDELAARFNGATGSSERLRLLNEMEPYDAALRDHIARTKRLDERQKKVDRIYQQIDEVSP